MVDGGCEISDGCFVTYEIEFCDVGVIFRCCVRPLASIQLTTVREDVSVTLRENLVPVVTQTVVL